MLENFNAFSKLAHLDFDIPLPHILLPLALSFVTFQQIAFLFDCYKRTKGELDENLHIDFVDYALFISFFPQLIAGPIVHHREMMPQFAKMGACNSVLGMQFRTCKNFQASTDFSLVESPKIFTNTKATPQLLPLRFCESQNLVEKSNQKFLTKFLLLFAFAKRRAPLNSLDSNPPRKADSQNLGAESTANINYEYLAKGIFIFSIGLFKKVFIADSFAKWVNAGFGVVEQGGVLNTLESWATSLSYTFQLYFDFSGYCDMAMGLALMFGIVLPLNFDSPYKSLNIAEFWRRWHITLGRFLKECLYIPLGGNRVSKILNLRNLFIVAFLSGIWHGAGWGFVIWGVLHGVAMVIHRIYAWWLDSIANRNNSSLRESRSDSWQSKPRESNQAKDAMSQKRINESHRFTQSKKIISDSRVANMDCFGDKSPRNDENIARFTKTHNNGLSLHFTQTKFYKFLCWFITFNFINIAWIFFRAENLNGAVNLIKGMFGVANVEIIHKWSKIFSALQGGTNEIIIWILCAIVACVAFKNGIEKLQNFEPTWKNIIFATVLTTIALFSLLANDYSPFLYFNF